MRGYLLSTACVSVLLAAIPASAQTMNYGMLEDVFGEPVTTSATGKPQKTSEVPVNMEIVTQDDIRRSGATTIPEALQFLTGINYRQSSYNDPELAIRGYDQPWNPRLLVLVNGRPVYEDFYGDVVWAAIPIQLDEIRQIEVVKGPNQALFGFNAASGVVNIITYDPLFDSTNALTVRSGTQGLANESGVVTGHIGDNAGIRLSASSERVNEFNTSNLNIANEEGVTFQHPMAYTANFDSRWQVSPYVTMSLEGASAQILRNFPADGVPEHDRDDDIRYQVAANTPLGLINVDGYWTWWSIDYEGTQPNQAYNTVYDLKVSDLFKVGVDNSFRINTEFKDDSSTGPFLAGGGTIRSWIYSLGVMWDWKVFDKLTFTNSIREDYLRLGFHGYILPLADVPTKDDYTGTRMATTSFNSGLVYTVTPEDTARFTVSRGFQLPSLDDLANQTLNAALVPGLTYIGNPSIRPTAVTNVELDYDHKIPAIDSTFRAGVYGQRNSALFGWEIALLTPPGCNTTTYNGCLFQSVNFGNSEEIGFEVGLKGASASGFRWDFGYTYASLTDQISANAVPGVYSRYDQSTPKHTIDVGLGYSVGQWEFDTAARWQSSWLDYSFAIGAYLPGQVTSNETVTARIGYRPTDYLTLGLTVDQLNQAREYQRTDLYGEAIPIERRVIISGTLHW